MNNEEHNDGYGFDLEHEAMAGEIVEIDGYDGYWRVDCVNIELAKYANEQFTDIYYDVYNIHTDEYIVAGDEDVTLVADASQADDFIANMVPKKKPFNGGLLDPRNLINPSDLDKEISDFWTMDTLFNQFRKSKEAENMAKENRKLTPREQSNKEAAEKKAARKKRKEYVDRALDGRNDAKELARVFPADKAKYERRIARYDAFLAKVSDGE